MPRPAPGATERHAAEALALAAMQWLASDEDRLQRFLDLSGIAPDTLRARLGEPAFLVGVLDHLLGDEKLLIDFSAWSDTPPSAVGAARRAIGGAWSDDV